MPGDPHDLEARRRAARAALRDGVERAGARAHFRSIGVDPDRLDGPIVGIASTWTGTMPCNFTQRELSDAAAAAVDAAGGVALPFNTIAVSDNQSQGTPGMRASLISREVIADSIELMAIAHDFDALVCIVGCDKTTPAALMALARIDKPAVLLYSGPQRAGHLGDRELTILEVWEALGAHERGMIDRDELDAIERAACPGAGTCAGQFTANTMAVALECLGLAELGDGLICAEDRADKAEAAARAGRRAVGARRDGPDGAALPRPAGAAQRDGGRGGERRLDERRPAPAGDRPRGGRRAHAGRADGAGQPHAGARQPLAGRPARGRDDASRGRHADADPRADRGRALRRRGADRGGRGVRRRRRRRGRARRRGAVRARRRRTSRAARCARCAATSPRTGAWSSWPGSRGPARPGPRACSTTSSRA